MVTSHIGISSLNFLFSFPASSSSTLLHETQTICRRKCNPDYTDQLHWWWLYQQCKVYAGSFFAKTNRGIEPSLFEGEALGLGAMYETRTIQVPGPFKVGPLPTSGSYIMIEFIEFGVCRGNQFVLGRKLAEMHKASLFENIDRAILTSWRLVEWEYQL